MASHNLILSACRRAATVQKLELSRGLDVLITIAATAPLLGFLAAAFAMVNSFVGCNGEKYSCLADLAGRLADAIIPIPFALALALGAIWIQRYLTSQVQVFELEMETTALALANALRK